MCNLETLQIIAYNNSAGPHVYNMMDWPRKLRTSDLTPVLLIIDFHLPSALFILLHKQVSFQCYHT